jgi:hypothetical protein
MTPLSDDASLAAKGTKETAAKTTTATTATAKPQSGNAGAMPQQPAGSKIDNLDTAAGVTPIAPTQTAPAQQTASQQAQQQLMSSSPQSAELTGQSATGTAMKPKSARKTLNLNPSPAWMKAQPYNPDNAANSENTAVPMGDGTPDAWMKPQPYNPGVLTAPGQ